MPNNSLNSDRFRLKEIPLYIFLLSFSFISFELAYLRLLSGLRIGWSLISFFIYGAAFLGLGIGSVCSLLRSEARIKNDLKKVFFLSPVSILLLVFISILIFVYKLSSFMAPTGEIVVEGLLDGAFMLFPFIVAVFVFFGFQIGAFLNYATKKRRVLLFTWAFELIGAAVGSILPVFLSFLNPLHAILLAVFSSCSIPFLWYRKEIYLGNMKKYFIILFLVMFLLIGCYIYLWGPINNSNIDMPKENGFFANLDSFLKNKNELFLGGWSPYRKINFRENELGDFELFYNNLLTTGTICGQDIYYYNNSGCKQKDILVIGAGGGNQIKTFLKDECVRSITAVELDPVTVRLVKEEFKNCAPYIHNPKVNLITKEGRYFLHNSNETYDMIIFPWADSWLAISSYGLVKAEEYLYTVEAFDDAIKHLNEGGEIDVILSAVLQHYHSEYYLANTRLKTTAARLFRNIFEVTKNMKNIVVSDVGPTSSSTDSTITLIYSKNDKKIDPNIPDEYVFTDKPKFIKKAMQIIPSTDDRPFFYIRGKSIPPAIKNFVLFIIVFSVLILSPIVLRLFQKREYYLKGFNPFFVLYFFFTGFIFMLILTTLIQKFLMSFGVPYLSSTVVIFTLLAGAGFAAILISYAGGNRMYRVLPPIIVGLALCMPFLLYYVSFLNSFLPYFPILWGVIIAVLLLFPIAVLIGLPFPIGMCLLREQNRKAVVIAYTADILGSIGGLICSVTIPILFKYTMLFYIAAFVYILMFVVYKRLILKKDI